MGKSGLSRGMKNEKIRSNISCILSICYLAFFNVLKCDSIEELVNEGTEKQYPAE